MTPSHRRPLPPPRPVPTWAVLAIAAGALVALALVGIVGKAVAYHGQPATLDATSSPTLSGPTTQTVTAEIPVTHRATATATATVTRTSVDTFYRDRSTTLTRTQTITATATATHTVVERTTATTTATVTVSPVLPPSP